MQPFLTVNVDTRALDAALAALGRPQLDVAVAKALADTAKNAMVKAVSLIARRTGLKSATVRPRRSPPTMSASVIITTHIRSSRRPIPLIDFPSTRQTATGVATRAWGRPRCFARPSSPPCRQATGACSAGQVGLVCQFASYGGLIFTARSRRPRSPRCCTA